MVFNEAHFAVLLAASAANATANAFQTGRAGSDSLLSHSNTPKRRNGKLMHSKETMQDLASLSITRGKEECQTDATAYVLQTRIPLPAMEYPWKKRSRSGSPMSWGRCDSTT